MDLINANRIAFPNECVKHIFTELFPFDDDFLALRVEVGVEDCQSGYSIGLLSDTRCDGPGVESIEASTSYY